MDSCKKTESNRQISVCAKDKLYVFFTPSIANVGGGQLYVNAKASWLEKNGWIVKIFYIAKGNIVLDGLKKYENGYLNALEFRFSSFSLKERESVLEQMLGDRINYDKIVIESYSYETALWGELLARKCKGKHICYLINEQHLPMTKSIKSFLNFKLQQNLLFGITPTNIPSILPNANPETTFLRAEGCSQFSAPDIDDNRMEKLPEDGFTILSIGRLEKPYMRNLADEICFFSSHLEVPVNYVMVGDTPDKDVKDSLMAILDKEPNLRVFFWGYTFPVPKRLYQRADVFVGCAGSAHSAYKERVPSITIDANDCQGIGILGETTENRLYRNSKEPCMPVSELLFNVYNTRVERRLRRQTLKPIVEEVDFSRHLAIIEAEFDNEYYPVETVKNKIWFDILYNSIKLIGGRSFLYKMKSLKQMFFPSR